MMAKDFDQHPMKTPKWNEILTYEGIIVLREQKEQTQFKQ